MIQILREVHVEAARGHVYTYAMRLIQFRAYGTHRGEHNWRDSLSSFQRGLLLKVQTVKCKGFKARGDQYSLLLGDG